MTNPYETATEEQRAIGSWWWCIHHESHLEPLTEPIENRVKFIRENKPENEIETRLLNMAPVLHPDRIPERVKAAWAEYNKALAECGPELMALHREEYPDTTWNGKSIFGGEK